MINLLSLLLALTAPVEAPKFKRIIQIVLENTDYQDALRQPYFSALTHQGALFTHFSAETHPSQPNYIAMIAASPLGVLGDSIVNVDAKHIGNLLTDKKLDWRAYAENYPGNCFLNKSNGKYVRKHVPFLSFLNVQRNESECAKVVNADQFEFDVTSHQLPEYSLYIPNLDNDGHDTSPAFSDHWLSSKFSSLISNKEFMNETLIIVTFDESESYWGHNQIYTVFVGANVIPGSTVTTPVNHYSILKMIEQNFNLENLGKGDAKATDIKGIWN